ncbi:putative 2OG-Fe(II) oxygenase [Novosphingobium album (ex Liu et al. 2023)]|uniref:2OG-Fe(II) oxygenase n=1 Tax=Novosphingobium album (ex Liu et al. 2023) TaxID=3031130 RepID=A0ABT5WSQ5_9SPHN|nr:putative 2OG-Fe(II) oxygenase [Novosphingobium album (ex Liu et al. 2023)]MDE8652033.1 putative 2OG-Fe(II) oxygenase [Novosphingobium album (ex Liu et al. 2023)]
MANDGSPARVWEQQRLEASRALIRSGRQAEARATLDAILAADARSTQALHLLGIVARLEGRLSEAEARQKATLEQDPLLEDAAVELARLLNAAGRAADAIACTEACAGLALPSQALLVERARAWQALERPDKRLEVRERIARLYPGKASTLHNLAAAQGDAGDAAAAEATAKQAMALGGDAPETWLVLARALQSQNRLAEADAAFGEAIRRRPGYFDALRDRAQLLWMSTGDIGAVLAQLDDGGAALPLLGRRMLQASFLAAAGDNGAAYRSIQSAGAHASAEAEAFAARLMLADDPASALAHARRAVALSPDFREGRLALIDALLAVQEEEEARGWIDRELELTPLDQGLIAARWTAWRIAADPRASELYDYAATVLTRKIDTPPGWGSLERYLADLADALERLHAFTAHPLDQSLRGGSQTSANLLVSQEPAILAFAQAIDGPIRQYLASLDLGDSPLRARRTGGYRVAGMWSVRLRSGGFHLSHVHPRGWISSACYIDVPTSAPEEGQRAGWLKLGEPAAPRLDPEFFVRPEPGLLVLFPSSMWHGTVPFAGPGRRLTIAFDIVPDEGSPLSVA